MSDITAPYSGKKAVVIGGTAFEATFTTGFELAVDGGLGQKLKPPQRQAKS